MKILHGISGAAGQPAILSNALNKLGVESHNVIAHRSKFGYKADFTIEPIGDGFEQYKALVEDAVENYDLFHFYFRPFFYFDHKRLGFPTAYDLMLLRLAGKKLIFNYRGSEVRKGSLFKQYTPYNYVDENPNDIFSYFPDVHVDRLNTVVNSLAHDVIVPDPELQSYVPGSKIIPRAIDIEEWPYCPPSPTNKRPLVVHAPSRRVVKGSQYVLDAVSQLKNEGLDFDFELIENLTNQEAREKYKAADIVVDQLRIGWYGVLSVECMALGKPILVYVRDDLEHHFDGMPPFMNTNPDKVVDDLRTLITDANLRQTLSQRARQYCEETHDANRVANQLLGIYRAAEQDDRPVEDIKPLLEYIRYHKLMFKKATKSAKLRKQDLLSFNMAKRVVSHIRSHGLMYTMKRAYRYLS